MRHLITIITLSMYGLHIDSIFLISFTAIYLGVFVLEITKSITHWRKLFDFEDFN